MIVQFKSKYELKIWIANTKAGFKIMTQNNTKTTMSGFGIDLNIQKIICK